MVSNAKSKQEEFICSVKRQPCPKQAWASCILQMTLPSRTAPAIANIAGKAAMNHTNASNKLKICGQKPLWTILPCYACAVHLLCQRKVLDRLVASEVFRLYSRFSDIFLKVFAKFVLIFNRETSSSLDLRTKSRVPICKAARDNKNPALQPGICLGFLM